MSQTEQQGRRLQAEVESVFPALAKAQASEGFWLKQERTNVLSRHLPSAWQHLCPASELVGLAAGAQARARVALSLDELHQLFISHVVKVAGLADFFFSVNRFNSRPSSSRARLAASGAPPVRASRWQHFRFLL